MGVRVLEPVDELARVARERRVLTPLRKHVGALRRSVSTLEGPGDEPSITKLWPVLKAAKEAVHALNVDDATKEELLRYCLEVKSRADAYARSLRAKREDSSDDDTFAALAILATREETWDEVQLEGITARTRVNELVRARAQHQLGIRQLEMQRDGMLEDYYKALVDVQRREGAGEADARLIGVSMALHKIEYEIERSNRDTREAKGTADQYAEMLGCVEDALQKLLKALKPG